MANIRPNDLPSEASPSTSDVVILDNLTTRKATISAVVNAARPFASQAEAEAGTATDKGMNPLTTAQAIAALGATQFASTAQGTLADSAVQPAALDAVKVPTGGTTGQVLAKASATDNDVTWTTAGTGDVVAANNLSDLASASTALSNLGGQPLSANLTTLAGVTPGTTGLALLDDASASAARTTLALQGFSSATSVNTQSGTGSFRQRITASDAPTDLKTWEIFQNGTTGSISYSLMSDTLDMRQSWMIVSRDDKIYYDFDYVAPGDAAVDKYTTDFMTLEVDSTNTPVNGRAIRGINGDPEGTLVIGADTYGAAGVPGVTVSTVPADWVVASVPGNFDDLMGNWPSNARMRRRIELMANDVVVREESGATGVKGLHIGVIKDGQLTTLASDRDGDDRYLKNSDTGGIWLSLVDGKLILASRLNDASPQDILFMVGNAYVGGWGGTDSEYWGVGTTNPSRHLHVNSAAQTLVSRFQSTGTRAEAEFTNDTTTGRVGMNSAQRMALSVGATLDVLQVSATGARVNGTNEFTKFYKGSTSLDFPSIAGGSSAELSWTVTGATTNDVLMVSGTMAASALEVGESRISAADTATVRCFNRSAGALDPTAKTFNYAVL